MNPAMTYRCGYDRNDQVAALAQKGLRLAVQILIVLSMGFVIQQIYGIHIYNSLHNYQINDIRYSCLLLKAQ